MTVRLGEREEHATEFAWQCVSKTLVQDLTPETVVMQFARVIYFLDRPDGEPEDCHCGAPHLPEVGIPTATDAALEDYLWMTQPHSGVMTLVVSLPMGASYRVGEKYLWGRGPIMEGIGKPYDEIPMGDFHGD